MIPWYQRNRCLVRFGSLTIVNVVYLEVFPMTHSRICYNTWCLDLYHLLNEFDATDSDGDRGAVHSLEDVQFDGTEVLP